MSLFLSLLALVLLPFPRQYAEQFGHFRNMDGISDCLEVTFVAEIPEAGIHQEEAYRLEVKRKRILIEATCSLGELRARQTLGQLTAGNPESIKCCRICDWPAFPYRGFMQDCGRSYISVEELKTEIKALAALKINVFHWHLTENEAWRIESRKYPQINSAENMTRFPGKFYRIEEIREIVALCNSLGMKLIPEIEMPGHSDAFKRCFGCSMQSWNGRKFLAELLEEACETFKGCEYFHIGTDEAEIYNPDFIPEAVAQIRSKGFKVMVRNPGWECKPGEIDARQIRSADGQAVPGIPAIDSRMRCLNHFDCFSDIRNLYRFKVCGQDEATEDVTGSEITIWHDRHISDETLMVKEHSLYPAAAVHAERTWRGGEAGDFFEFEERFIELKEKTMAELPILYVKQGDMKWGITKAFPNDGNPDASFPPEKDFPWIWAEAYVRGAGAYLKHASGDESLQLYNDPQPNSTAYAWTYVWSPKDQIAGLSAEFRNYGSSETHLPPEGGKWDGKGSRVWLNGDEITPSAWTSENGNPPSGKAPEVKLRQGWNYVLLKLPVGEFSTGETRLAKWMFNFVFVTPDGDESLTDLKYDPDYLNGDRRVFNFSCSPDVKRGR